MYFDFFSIHAQRTALRTASNCMRGIDMDSFPQVLEVTPTLMNTITYSDRSVVELTCLCWVRISEGYRSNRECLERAINVDLLKILYGLIPIPGNANAVHPATFQDLLRIFRSISKASPQLSFELLKLDIIESFYQILTGASSVPDFETTNAQHHITLDSKWRDSVPTIMKIIVDLLPSLPKDTMFSSRRFKSNHSSPSAAVTETAVDPRVEWFKETPQVLFKLDLILIPLILDMYASTVNLRVRQLVTRTLVKLLHYSDSETLSKVLKNVTLSSFLSGILTRQEHPVLLIDALYQTELMIQKLPQVYHFLFEREGVLHEIESLSKLPYVEEEETVVNQQSQKKESDSLPNTQPSEDINNTTVDESDGTTTDADNIKREPSNNDKKDDEEEDDEEDEDEDESDNDNPSKGKRSGKSASTKSVGSSSGLRSPSSSASQRRLFDSADLQAMMRNHHLLQHQQRVSRHQHYSENEKGVGRGSTRKYIIQLAQHFVQHYFNKTSEDGTPLASAGSSLKEIVQFTNDLLSPTDQDPASEQTLIKLSAYLRDSIMGISSFELINTGLMKALLAYLTQSDDTQWKVPLKSRIQLFEHIFVDQPDIDVDGNNALKKLVVRLQEILSRSETFEVVTPMESPLGTDSLRNPTSMLAKQLRLRLSGTGDDIPSNYKQLMVSTHAVATFRVLEDYLLARISAASSLMRDMEEEEDEDEEDEVEIDEEDHLLIEDENNRDHMDVDEDHDTVMSEALDVTKDETEGEEEDESQGKQTKEDAKASSSTNTKPTTGASDKTATSKKDGEWKIRFSLNDSVISNDSTVYAAVHQYEMSSLEGRATFAGQSRLSSRNIWASSYPVTYERIWVPHTESDEEEGKKSSSTVVRQLADIGLPKDLKEDSTCYQVLQLLKALSPAIAKHPHGISAQDFINRKLTAKANRQLEEPLIVASSCLPTWIYWLMSETPFLFPFETRYLFIQSTSFGYARLIARWQSLQMRNNTQNGPRNDTSDQQPVLGRMERQKVRIMRTQMLESAIKILDLFGSSPTVLEIEYMGEEGTGMGPTLEFYASTSKEFSKHSLNMWRGSNKTEKGFVQSASGLFPKTLAKSSSRSTKKIVHLFKALGQFIAKGLLDFRIIDIPFSPAFFKIVLDDLKPSPELLKVSVYFDMIKRMTDNDYDDYIGD
jgi:E3 ubiquitin-protein ligase TRIP12